MRFAAIADIHGNRAALEAVLADIDALGIADVVNLGDHVSGPMEPRGTADLLMARDIACIAGNHERQLLSPDIAAMGRTDRFAREQLDARHMEWLAALPPTMLYRGEVFLCHGTPTCDNTYWLESVAADGVRAATQDEIEARAAGTDAALMLCGHTHTPRMVRLRDGRAILNPGSVGCPAYEDDTPHPHRVETGTPHASYAILERTCGRWSATFRLVPYDHMAMADMALANGRPEWARALASGWTR